MLRSLKFENNTFDKYTISFCLRNITNMFQAFREAHRVLKPGGKYYCIEFSRPLSIFFISKIYKIINLILYPFLEKIVSKDKKLIII